MTAKWRRIIWILAVLSVLLVLCGCNDSRGDPSDIPPKNTARISLVASHSSPVFLFEEIVPLDNALVRDRYQKALAYYLDHPHLTSLICERLSELERYLSDVLTSHNLHTDYRYLMAIESSLEPRANSGRAVGFAQFVSGTARRYGLSIGNGLDERLSLESFEAGARYIQFLERMFDDPLLACAAYNTGENRIPTLTRLQKHSDYWTLYFPYDETERYVPLVAAFKYIYEQRLVFFSARDPITFEVHVCKERAQTPIVAYLSSRGIDPSQNIRWNRHLTKGLTVYGARIYVQKPYLISPAEPRTYYHRAQHTQELLAE